MEKYKLVRRECVSVSGITNTQETSIGEHEFRLTSHGKMKTYLTAALSKLEREDVRQVHFKATGKAINKLVSVVEVVKRRIPGLHQVTELGTMKNKEYYEPLEKGLKQVEQVKSISMLKILLSKDFNKKEMNKHVGYQKG